MCSEAVHLFVPERNFDQVVQPLPTVPVESGRVGHHFSYIEIDTCMT